VLKIGVLLGDDIGLEVVPEAVKVMKAAAKKAGLEVQWQDLPIGKRGHELHGHTMPRSTVEALEKMDGFLCGPIGHAAYPRNDPTWIMPPLRKRLDLYASIKPVKSYPNIKSVHKDVDIVFLREVTEGMQSSDTVVAGVGEFRPNDDITIASRVITRRGSSRVAREAFEIARTRARKVVTSVHKEPVYRLACGMFAEECRKLVTEYPDVRLTEVLVDGFAMKLVMNPQQFDVVVTTNQFGDILTDEGAGVVGGLGLAPGRDVAGDTRLGAGHRGQRHCQSLCADHVGPDAVRLARPKARRAKGHAGGTPDQRSGGQGHRRSERPYRRSRRQGFNNADGRRHCQFGLSLMPLIRSLHPHSCPLPGAAGIRPG